MASAGPVSNSPAERRGRSYRGRGFTLIELLIALGLSAMLMTMLTAGVYSVIRDWDNNHQGLSRRLDQTVAMLQIERALQGAFAHSYRDPDTLSRYIFFQGQPERMSWVSTVSPQRRDGLTAWRLTSEPGDGVYLSLTPALTDDPRPRFEEVEPRLLLSGYTAEFSYLYEESEASRQWRDTWNGEQRYGLPLAVHVRLQPTDGDGEDRPLDIVAPIDANRHRSIERNPLAEE